MQGRRWRVRLQYHISPIPPRLRSRSWGQAPVQHARCRGTAPRVGPKMAFKGKRRASWGAPAEGSDPRGGRRAPRALSLGPPRPLGARRWPGKTEGVRKNDSATRFPPLLPAEPGAAGCTGAFCICGARPRAPPQRVRAVPGCVSGFPVRERLLFGSGCICSACVLVWGTPVGAGGSAVPRVPICRVRSCLACTGASVYLTACV